jgi:ribosomal protein L20A (L18A)
MFEEKTKRNIRANTGNNAENIDFSRISSKHRISRR